MILIALLKNPIVNIWWYSEGEGGRGSKILKILMISYWDGPSVFFSCLNMEENYFFHVWEILQKLWTWKFFRTWKKIFAILVRFPKISRRSCDLLSVLCASEISNISKTDSKYWKFSRCARCKLSNQINYYIGIFDVSSEEIFYVFFFARRAKFFWEWFTKNLHVEEKVKIKHCRELTRV